MSLLKFFFWALCLFVFLLVAGLAYMVSNLAPAAEPWTPDIDAAADIKARPSAPCADNNPLRNAYFGDLHVHTAFSWDGAGRGMYTTPAQAYQFASGEALGLPPYDAQGNGLRTVQLERPLDFAAVTDHAEAIGEVNLCITPGSQRFNSAACQAFRGEEKYGFFPKGMSPMAAIKGNTRQQDMCGADGALCREATLAAWQATQQAAEE